MFNWHFNYLLIYAIWIRLLPSRGCFKCYVHFMLLFAFLLNNSFWWTNMLIYVNLKWWFLQGLSQLLRPISLRLSLLVFFFVQFCIELCIKVLLEQDGSQVIQLNFMFFATLVVISIVFHIFLGANDVALHIQEECADSNFIHALNIILIRHWLTSCRIFNE